jgi:ferredoxin
VPGRRRLAGDLCPYNVRSAGLLACERAETELESKQREPFLLAYVIAEPCIGQKDNSCVEVCPVDCIHPTPDEPDYESVEQLYIDPDECIDCDACVEACPVDACFAEDQLPDEWTKYIEINSGYYAGK